MRLSPSNISVINKLVTEQECVINVHGMECEYKVINDNTVPSLCSRIYHLPGLHEINSLICDPISSTCAQRLSNSLKSCESLKI